MANQLFPAPARALDSIGMPAAGARARFYLTGTTTLVTVYADEALSVAHPSPLLYNARGELPQVFTSGADTIKCVVKDADESTLFTLDPAPQVNTTAFSAGAVAFSPTTGISASNVQAAIETVQENVDLVADAIDENVPLITAAAPPGAVISFARATAPTGWLICDGAEVSRTTYEALFDAIGTVFGAGDGTTTFKLPDLRGQFIRGAALAGTVDAGRAFGSAQTDAFQAHKHTSSAPMLVEIDEDAFGGANLGARRELSTVLDGYAADGANGTPRTAAETRPVNVALLYCIKT